MKSRIIEDVVNEGIRKTINRFREKPFHYFTEADIHSSLLNDMMTGSSDVLAHRPERDLHHISVSLVHQEYPTNFRYKKSRLLDGCNREYIEKTKLTYKDKNGKGHGGRGNFDLAILNQGFVLDMLNNHDLGEALENIINKNNQNAIKRSKKSVHAFLRELLYAIEVKFIHSINARQINMLHEVIKDDQKLLLAYSNSDGYIKPINLVFCSTPAKKSNGDIKPVVDLIKEYIREGKVKDRKGRLFNHPMQIATIFIESYIGPKSVKSTSPPLAIIPDNDWALKLARKINADYLRKDYEN